MTSDFSTAERTALVELWQADALAGIDPSYPAFPGAVGRSGALLVKRGLAEKVGMFTYEKGCRYMRYKITEEGRSAAITVRTAGKARSVTI